MMRDWTGSRVRADAEKVPCRYCHAVPGDPCMTECGKELEAFPAHTVRINDSQKAGGHPYAPEESNT
jgi:hypothetical protein